MPKNKNTSDGETLVGIVTPVQWDQDDRVSAVALSATDDEAYWIENGDKFLKLISSQIEAVGRIRRDRKQSRSISIKRYRIIDDESL